MAKQRVPASGYRSLGPLGMLLCSVGVGIIGGLGAVVFRAMIAFFHNAFFERKFSLLYDANVFTGVEAWGAWIILAPVVGALGVAFLVTNFAAEAKGHGVPEVMEAVYFKKGVMRPVVVWIKALASALCIGSGGSVGREGPIIQIGSAMGSWIAQKAGLMPWQRIVLLACGAGAGIAATFNTPLGGVLFAVEIILHEISVRTLVPVAVATAMASYVGQLVFGPNPSFLIPAFEASYFRPTNPSELLAYCVLGILMGVLSAVFIKVIYSFEDFFDDKVGGGYFVRHILGMTAVGLVIYVMMRTTGHYYVEGVGYSTVQATLSGLLNSAPLLLLLFVLKLLVTALTLGSGGSGGIFSPSLFLGATFGAAFGTLLSRLIPSLLVSPPAFAVCGMAGMVGGVTGAAVTAIVMVFEMTRDYSIVIPMTLTVAIAYGVRKALSRHSIYTMKLARRGEVAPEAFYTNLVLMRSAGELMTPVKVVSAERPVSEVILATGGPAFAIVVKGADIVGVVTVARLPAEVLKDSTCETLADGRFTVVTKSDELLNVIRRMHDRVAAFAVVLGRDNRGQDGPIGVISQEMIGASFIDSSDVMSG